MISLYFNSLQLSSLSILLFSSFSPSLVLVFYPFFKFLSILYNIPCLLFFIFIISCSPFHSPVFLVLHFFIPFHPSLHFLSFLCFSILLLKISPTSPSSLSLFPAPLFLPLFSLFSSSFLSILPLICFLFLVSIVYPFSFFLPFHISTISPSFSLFPAPFHSLVFLILFIPFHPSLHSLSFPCFSILPFQFLSFLPYVHRLLFFIFIIPFPFSLQLFSLFSTSSFLSILPYISSLSFPCFSNLPFQFLSSLPYIYRLLFFIFIIPCFPFPVPSLPFNQSPPLPFLLYDVHILHSSILSSSNHLVPPLFSFLMVLLSFMFGYFMPLFLPMSCLPSLPFLSFLLVYPSFMSCYLMHLFIPMSCLPTLPFSVSLLLHFSSFSRTIYEVSQIFKNSVR